MMKNQIKSFRKSVAAFSFLTLISSSISGQLIAHFPMDIEKNSIREVQSNQSFMINGLFTPESKPGAEGTAVRFDGYTTFVEAGIDATVLNEKALTFSLWCAVETYPMMNPDEAVNSYTVIAGNMDDGKRSGFAFLMSSQGDYSFEVYMGGWKVTCKGEDKLFRYEWVHLAAVINTEARQISLYHNGVQTGVQQVNGIISTGENKFMIGKSTEDIASGPFPLNTFNGLIDDIRIYNTALSAAETGYKLPENEADLSISSTRYQDDLLRPVFHGMPATSWTNEPHGLIFYDNKYHLFFQKNANGPYWGRLHWGHITSENLYEWEEEKIALAPSAEYDMKGCWSGCIYMDDALTAGKPHIYYTAVDNGKATIATAYPEDDQLVNWEKAPSNPIIPGKPSGLSDDFRDPYVFTANGKHYMIVGTSKEGKGAATLHEYNPANNTWSNDGKIFFQATTANSAGHFWEMPVIIQMENDKWLFLVTPLSGKQGVEVLYWVGSINSDGTFQPLATFGNEPREVELGSFGKDGYGMLSPSVVQKEGKTIAIGIVPDKLSSKDNYNLGWAHTFSLPREWTLDANNNLIQQPYEGLSQMRSEEHFTAKALPVSNSHSLTSVKGRTIEIKANLTVGEANKAGVRFFKNGTSAVEAYYDYATNKMVVDTRTITRLVNDNGSFNGLYESVLPERLEKGSQLTLHIFVDHSITDIFINDKWAFSMRIFPTDLSAIDTEVFSEGGTTTFNSIDAWILQGEKGPGNTIPNEMVANYELKVVNGRLEYKNIPPFSMISFYDLSGRLLEKKNLNTPEGNCRIPAHGLLIINITGKEINYTTKLFSVDP